MINIDTAIKANEMRILEYKRDIIRHPKDADKKERSIKLLRLSNQALRLRKPKTVTEKETHSVFGFSFGKCPECGAPVNDKDKCCNMCGQALDWKTEGTVNTNEN